jgi:hypothetical protein
MTPEAQRIAIAEACGWKKIRSHWQKGKATAFLNESHAHQQLPDYLNDLNAVHEAEALLYRYEAKLFEEKLFNILESEVMHTGEFALIHATAAQRAEALLKALNLWEEASK